MKTRFILASSLTLLATCTLLHGQSPAASISIGEDLARLPLAGDWNGDGQREIGWFESSTAELYRCGPYLVAPGLQGFQKCSVHRLSPTTRGWTPLTINWNGGAAEEIAIYDPESGRLYLLSFLNQITARIQFLLEGLPGRIPVAGDWNGNGLDSVGFYDPREKVFSFLEDLDSQVYHEYDFGPRCLDDPVLHPMAADRDGDGAETLGLHVNEQGVYLSNRPWTNVPEEAFFLNWDARVVAGPWGEDHFLVYDPASHMVLVVTTTEALADPGDPASGIPADWPKDPEYLVGGCGGITQ